MKSITTILIESIVVGLLLIPFTYVAGYLAKMIVSKPSLPDICKKWNKNYIMEINLFIAGFLFHLTLEVLGINEWYAKNYIT